MKKIHVVQKFIKNNLDSFPEALMVSVNKQRGGALEP